MPDNFDAIVCWKYPLMTIFQDSIHIAIEPFQLSNENTSIMCDNIDCDYICKMSGILRQG